MYTKVIRNQFEIKEGTIIHIAHGGQSSHPVTGTADSILIWTGRDRTPFTDGERYRYADVFAVHEDDFAAKLCRQPSCCGSKYAIKHLPC
jgi:hypothetical protein